MVLFSKMPVFVSHLLHGNAWLATQHSERFLNVTLCGVLVREHAGAGREE
jgi:hypothetical protein